MAILLAFLTSVFYGVFDFTGAMTTRRVPVFTVAFWANISGLVLAVLIGAGHHLWNGAVFTLSDFAWGAVSGVAGVIGVLFYFEGLAKGRMAVVAPVSAITLSLVPFLFGLLTGERYALLSWIGVALAAPALWLTVATRRVQRGPAKAVLGLAAGLSFSLVFISMAQISPEAGLWPLVTFKIGSLATVMLWIRVKRVSLKTTGRERLMSFVAGGSVLANLTYLLAVQIGPLGLVAVVSSFYPGVVVLLAYLVFKERISATRLAGLALSLVAVSLIAL